MVWGHVNTAILRALPPPFLLPPTPSPFPCLARFRLARHFISDHRAAHVPPFHPFASMVSAPPRRAVQSATALCALEATRRQERRERYLSGKERKKNDAKEKRKKEEK